MRGRVMAIPFVMAGVVAIGMWSAVSAKQAQSSKSTEETAIRDVIRRYVEAREKRDAKAIEALFTVDADQLISSGEWRKGRPEIVKGTLASSQNTGGTRTITIETVRLVAPGAAIADGRYEIAGLAGGAARSMWTSFTLSHTGDGWRIAAIRNMLPAPAAPSKSPAVNPTSKPRA